MNFKQFKLARIFVAMFIGATVAIASTTENTLLALAAVVIGMAFMILVRKRTKVILSDERTEKIAGTSARFTYAIHTTFIALLSLFLIINGKNTGDAFTESVGTVLSFTALLSVAIYALSYQYFNKFYGDDQ
ncbi:MAG: DUF2178 domain-containing protein [Patescibacteria group bacterium]|nr:DUF2178 domain-containing protein [Patescibacteria group bacterium]